DPVLPEPAQSATPDVQGLLMEQALAAAPAHPAPPKDPSPPVRSFEQRPAGPGPVVPPPETSPEGRPTGRRWLIAAGAALAAVAVTATVLYLNLTGRDAPVVPPPGGGGGQNQEVATDVGRRIAAGVDYIAGP